MSERKITLKERILFGTNAFPDQITYQAFTIYVFTYYFAVVGLSMLEMWIGFVLWGIWNMFNDPLLGALSEKTKQKGKLGKRKFYLIISFIPLSLIMIFLFTVTARNPFISSEFGFEFWYFLIIIFTFELFYTMFSVNTNAVFPEMFPTEKQRGDVNVFIKSFTMLAVILASLIPTFIITPLAPTIDPETSPIGYVEQVAKIQFEYIFAGIFLSVIIGVMATIFIFLGVKEKEEQRTDFEKRPGFFKSLRITFSNKTFLKFTFGNMLIWYCFNVLLTVFPLYAVHVLKRGEGDLLIGVTLMLALLFAAFFMPLQSWIRKKLGTRKGLMIGMGIWIITLFPLILLSDNELSRTLSFVVFATIGFGLSAVLYFIDLIHGDIIDQDALKFGVRRAGSYYGVNAFIHRFSMILGITTIYIIFSGTGWSKYEPIVADPVLREIGIKLLMFVFPSIALIGSILFFKSYGLHGEILEKMRAELKEHPELKPQ
ncbi:MAG: MFS transporter [Candidatus Heimdallarchaeota archaeon]